MSNVLSRAKGPQRPVTCTEVVPCPWCGEDACPECGKEFTVAGSIEHGLACVGLLSPADMKYLAATASI
jgi:hypothetical protein